MSRFTRNREFVPRWNLDRRLHIQVASRDLSASLTKFLADRVSSGLRWRWVRESALAASLGDLERGGEHARKDRETAQPSIVAIHFVSQARVAVGFEAHHAVEIHGGSVRVDDAAPGDLRAYLAHMNAGFCKLLRVLDRKLDSINCDASLIGRLEFKC